MRRILYENALSIVLFGLFFVLIFFGQGLAGQAKNNLERERHGELPLSYPEYLHSSHFLEATMENWESEFLQMFAYLWLTSFLRQKGSAESKKLDEPEAVDRDPRQFQDKKDAPGPVRKGGWILKVYENSLLLAFFSLFLISFMFHAVGGAKEYNEEILSHGGETVTMLEYLGTSSFWFESFQNWQSEFLAIGAIVVLSIWLRQRGAPESKPVDSPHSFTGKE